MAWVTEQFLETWRSGEHIGGDAPKSVVQIRRGNWRRDYRVWTGPQIRAVIPYESENAVAWFPIFTETTPWVTVPNIEAVDLSQSFEQNGITVATVTLDNVAYVQQTGPLGHLFHLIERGYLAPQRGYTPAARPGSGLAQNEWFDVLTGMANIRIWQGFGDPVLVDGSMPEDGGSNGTWTFNGLIDDVDPDSSPPKIVVTARMAKLLTDQRVFGWAKTRALRDPVTFYDRLEADETTEQGYQASASSVRSSSDEWRPSNVLDKDSESTPTFWRSAARSADNITEWVQIRVPEGRYTNIVLHTEPGMEAFIGFFLKNQSGDEPPLVDGVSAPGGWYDGGFGGATVPGAAGGWQYVAHIPSTAAGRQIIDLGREFTVGKGSIIRVAFRNLKQVDEGSTSYFAQVRQLQGRMRRRSQDIIDAKYILVDDASDVVRIVLRWAGFQEWEVEDTGVRLKGRLIFNRADFQIDIVKKIAEQTGFVFFIADPTDGSSWGVPTFRRNAALLRETNALVQEVRDTDLLTGLKVKESEEPRAYIIRVRGKEATKMAGGRTLGGDRVRRVMAVYRPPWTTDNTMAGVIKHFTHQDSALRTFTECLMGCYLVAIAEALAALTATIEIPGLPFVELDDQVGLMDAGTGINSRLWVVDRQSQFRGGERTSWRTTLGGSLIDNPDLDAIIGEILTQKWGNITNPVAVGQTRTRRVR